MKKKKNQGRRAVILGSCQEEGAGEEDERSLSLGLRMAVVQQWSSYKTDWGGDFRKSGGKPRVSGKPQKALASIQKKKKQEEQKEVRTQRQTRLTQCS